MRTILLLHMSFRNKGDALMVEAIRRELGSEHRWLVPASIAARSPSDCRAFGVCLVSDLAGGPKGQEIFNRGVRFASSAAAGLPSSFRRRLGVYLVDDIDVAIDVSGYSYGDHWGQKQVDHGIELYRAVKKAGARLILMPKTWGPFEKVSHDSVRKLISFADVVFARDQTSLSTLRLIVDGSDADRIRFAPDYTHGVDAMAARVDPLPSDQAFIIPSSRVIDSGTLSRAGYYEVMATAKRALEARGLQARLLVHEISSDLSFIDDAGLMGFSRELIVTERDAVALKSRISGARAVVTSRLHGLYNALNAAVPVAVLPWSFKYEEALLQYGCAECLIDLEDPIRSVVEKIDLITDPSSSALLIAKMMRGRESCAEASARMWEKVHEVVALSPKTESPGGSEGHSGSG
jgi:hypothetical protein